MVDPVKGPGRCPRGGSVPGKPWCRRSSLSASLTKNVSPNVGRFRFAVGFRPQHPHLEESTKG